MFETIRDLSSVVGGLKVPNDPPKTPGLPPGEPRLDLPVPGRPDPLPAPGFPPTSPNPLPLPIGPPDWFGAAK